jgi:hypothetical protein
LTDISPYSFGLMMGFRTPNIGRLAREGLMFTDCYREHSCSVGRSAFITGQSVFRTGRSKVGLPGANQWLSKDHPTIAELLKPPVRHELPRRLQRVPAHCARHAGGRFASWSRPWTTCRLTRPTLGIAESGAR